jgi:hypothetical protein
MFCDIDLYTLCYYICCLLWRMYEMHPALFLKTGCDTQEGRTPHMDTQTHRRQTNVRKEDAPTRTRRSEPRRQAKT